MFNCDCLIHPFQNDPGTSQRDRLMDALLANAVKIDGRTLADLLDFFVQLSPHVNYYDLGMNAGDWQPFFKKSIPFNLASLIKFPAEALEDNFNIYNALFLRRPSPSGLQLKASFIFYHFIDRVNRWSLNLRDSALPIEAELELLIRNKLQFPVKEFIALVNAGVEGYGISRIAFSALYENKVWNIDLPDLYAIDTSYQDGSTSKYERIVRLSERINSVFPVLSEGVRNLGALATDNLELSLSNYADALKQTYQPHLGLLFAFLAMFRNLQDNLNGYTRKHLDFFYKEVLKFQPDPAVPDRTYVLLEIQKQLKRYLLKKGTFLKAGKDDNKQEVLFSLTDDIVVNKTQVAQLSTLFLNNQSTFSQTYLEGLYIAPNAGKADGVDKAFQGEVRNFPTLGAKDSKYLDPDTGELSQYPNARIGFILASPVLYLQGGTRKISVTIACQLKDSCAELSSAAEIATGNCCDEGAIASAAETVYADFLPAEAIYETVKANINKSFVCVDQVALQNVLKKGFSKDLVRRIKDHFLIANENHRACYCDVRLYLKEKCVEWSEWDAFISSFLIDDSQREVLDELFPVQKILEVYLSGTKDWLKADEVGISMGSLDTNKKFLLHLETVVGPDKPEVTFYDPDVLKEDLNTTKPVLKVELNTRIRLEYTIVKGLGGGRGNDDCCRQNDDCCLLRNEAEPPQLISSFHFFRNVGIIKKRGTDPLVTNDETRINVEVCGLKKFLVQNDEGVQDVNAPIYPFGVRPRTEANFLIGSEEIFMKEWTEIFVNLTWKDKPAVGFEKYYVAYQTRLLGNPPENVVTEDKFKMELALLTDGSWVPWKYTAVCDNLPGRKYNLFQAYTASNHPYCTDVPSYTHQYFISHNDDFINLGYPAEPLKFKGLTRFDTGTRNSFMRITLKCQDFQHEIYSFILARQMMAFAKLPKETVDGAVYYDPSAPNPVVFSADDIREDLNNAKPIADRVAKDVNDPGGNGLVQTAGLSGDITGSDADRVRTILYPNSFLFPGGLNLMGDSAKVKDLVDKVTARIIDIAKYAAIIPNEPWTPMISSIALDYKATASMKDIDLVHLYPFAGTYKQEEIALQPALFPVFCDEGTLYLGMTGLIPGENLSLLFQLAEATADSEARREEVYWHYLDNNSWKKLRKGFEVIEDGTEDLTSSGIIKISLPENISKANTVMPKDLYWIKASMRMNSSAVGETTGIHPQAVQAVFSSGEGNDLSRLSTALPAGTISKLEEADTAVKSISQPYPGFEGKVPEAQEQFYVRVSEQLRHKGRAIQAWDYERIILEEFPEVYKAKCLNHAFALDAHQYKNDFPYAPGFVVLAVIPDLNKLSAGNSFEPRVPVSILEKIALYLTRKTSPFVRFRAMNPRYEQLNLCIRVQLQAGADRSYFQEKLKQDIREFLAPWSVGLYEKLSFGQCVYRSDITRFIETRTYVDHITDLRMSGDGSVPLTGTTVVCPDTARSILIAGEIEVCTEAPECEDWGRYIACEGKVINRCDTKPWPVTDYCGAGGKRN